MSTGTDTVALARAVDFLARTQLPSGGFSLRYGFDVAAGPTEPDDNALFGTALIAWSLGFCRDRDARAVLARAIAHLRAHEEPGGVWRHWTPAAPQYHVVAPDVDDTAYISTVLRANGIAPPDNRRVLLANRDRRGLFYTWFIARRRPPRSVRLWLIAARRARHPLEGRKLWTTTPAFPSDVDGIVNANVLAYLGDGPHAEPDVPPAARRGRPERAGRRRRREQPRTGDSHLPEEHIAGQDEAGERRHEHGSESRRHTGNTVPGARRRRAGGQRAEPGAEGVVALPPEQVEGGSEPAEHARRHPTGAGRPSPCAPPREWARKHAGGGEQLVASCRGAS